MAYKGISTDTPEVAGERAAATSRFSEAVTSGETQRITYNNQTVDVEIGRIDHAALGRPVDKQYERNLATVNSRLNAIGVSKATVVNFLPIVLLSDSCLDPLKPAKASIKPPKDGEPYTTFVFEKAFIEPARLGADSPNIAFEWHPITLAQEFSKINPKGVLSFIGIPSDLTRTDWLERVSTEEQHHGMTYGKILEHTEQEAIAWMQEQLRAGNEDDRLKRNPSERAKASARRLFHLGRIKEMPLWVEKQRDVNQKIPMCPKCQRPSEPGASQCTNNNCGYIIDPRRAYEIDAIAEDHPSLERLTRAEVEEMGISDYVAETRDEKVIRLAEKTGIKPLSLVAQRMLQTQDEVLESQQKANAEMVAKAITKAANKKE